MIELYHGFKLRVLNGRTEGDRLGNFTCLTPNGVSEELLTEIMGFVVSPIMGWSSHCLISFVLKSGVHVKPKKSPSQLHPLPVSFKWNNIFKTKFLDELSSQQVVDRLNKFSSACLKDFFYDVDDAVKDLSDVVFSVAEATLSVKSGLPVLKNPKIPGKRKTSGFINLVSNLKEKYCALEN